MTETFENLIVPTFRKPWNSFVTGTAKELWLKGGRGSCKSTFAAYAIVAGVMAHPNVNAMVLRKHKEDIKSSVYNQIMFAIEKLDGVFPEQGIYKRWRFRSSPADMTFDNNRAIIFHGLDDPRKRKSEKPPRGYFGYLWCEEFDEFAGMEEIGSLMKSVLRGGEIGQAIFTYNPPQSTSSWVNAESARRKNGREVYHSTYLDVANFHPDWLGETFLVEAAEMKRLNEKQYRYELLGEATGTGGEIFTNVSEGEITNEQIASFKCVRHGMDFGFTNDPTTLMSVAYDSRTKTIYIFGEWYAQGQFTDGMICGHRLWQSDGIYSWQSSAADSEITGGIASIVLDDDARGVPYHLQVYAVMQLEETAKERPYHTVYDVTPCEFEMIGNTATVVMRDLLDFAKGMIPFHGVILKPLTSSGDDWQTVYVKIRGFLIQRIRGNHTLY